MSALDAREPALACHLRLCLRVEQRSDSARVWLQCRRCGRRYDVADRRSVARSRLQLVETGAADRGWGWEAR